MDYNTAKATVRRYRGQAVGMVMSNGLTFNIVVKDTTSAWLKGELTDADEPADVQIDFAEIIAVVVPRSASPNLTNA